MRRLLILGNTNAVTYREVFPHIRDGRMWLGATGNGSDMVFAVPAEAEVRQQDRDKAKRMGYDGNYTRLGNACWFTNIDHRRRHEPLLLMTAAETYPEYDNYDAIEVSKVKHIPADHDGVMGVPISFLDKHDPDQFEIVGTTESEGKGFSNGLWDASSGVAQAMVNGRRVYKRLLIRRIAQ